MENPPALTFELLCSSVDLTCFATPTMDDMWTWVRAAELKWKMNDADAGAHDIQGDVLLKHVVRMVDLVDVQSLEYEHVAEKFIHYRYLVMNFARLFKRYASDDDELYLKLRRFEKAILRAEAMIKNLVCLNHTLQHMTERRDGPITDYPDDDKEFIEFTEADCKTTFQKFLYLVIQDLEMRNYKRCDETLLKPKYVTQVSNFESGESTVERKTMAYESVGTIREYLDRIASFDVSKKLWSCMVASPGNKEAAVKYIKECRMECLPDIQENRHLRSFSGKDGYGGGVYDQNTDTFWVYGDEARWPEIADGIQEERRKFDPTYTCTSPSGHDDALIHYDDAFEGAEEFAEIVPGNCSSGEATGERKWWSIDPMTIPTPEIDKVLEDQGVTTEWEKFVCYAKFGRNFYKVKEKDRHENMFFVYGLGGTGKSLIIAYMSGFYPTHRVVNLNANMQKDFGVAYVKDAYFVTCLEVQEDFNFPENDFKAACSGERVMANKKHEDPVDINPWSAHMMFAGNHMFKNYKDGGGQLSRRVDGLIFENQIDEKDANLCDLLEEKRFLYLRKMNLCYLKWIFELNGRVPKKTKEDMPNCMFKFTSFLRSQFNPLDSFLQDESNGLYIPALCDDDPRRGNDVGDVKIPLSDFKNLFSEYCSLNRIPSKLVRCIDFKEQSTYISIFRQYRMDKKKDVVSGKEIISGCSPI